MSLKHAGHKEEKVNAAPNLLNEKIFDVIKFTAEEFMLGKLRDIDHVDYLSLSPYAIHEYTRALLFQ